MLKISGERCCGCLQVWSHHMLSTWCWGVQSSGELTWLNDTNIRWQVLRAALYYRCSFSLSSMKVREGSCLNFIVIIEWVWSFHGLSQIQVVRVFIEHLLLVLQIDLRHVSVQRILDLISTYILMITSCSAKRTLTIIWHILLLADSIWICITQIRISNVFSHSSFVDFTVSTEYLRIVIFVSFSTRQTVWCSFS